MSYGLLFVILMAYMAIKILMFFRSEVFSAALQEVGRNLNMMGVNSSHTMFITGVFYVHMVTAMCALGALLPAWCVLGTLCLFEGASLVKYLTGRRKNKPLLKVSFA